MRRGYFVEHLGGSQFALPGAVDELRAAVQGARRSDRRDGPGQPVRRRAALASGRRRSPSGPHRRRPRGARGRRPCVLPGAWRSDRAVVPGRAGRALDGRSSRGRVARPGRAGAVGTFGGGGAPAGRGRGARPHGARRTCRDGVMAARVRCDPARAEARLMPEGDILRRTAARLDRALAGRLLQRRSCAGRTPVASSWPAAQCSSPPPTGSTCSRAWTTAAPCTPTCGWRARGPSIGPGARERARPVGARGAGRRLDGAGSPARHARRAADPRRGNPDWPPRPGRARGRLPGRRAPGRPRPDGRRPAADRRGAPGPDGAGRARDDLDRRGPVRAPRVAVDASARDGRPGEPGDDRTNPHEPRRHD